MWVKIDDRAALHPKLLRAGPEACWLWVAALCHCNAYTTEGRIGRDVLRTIYPHESWPAERLEALAARLCDLNLWGADDAGWLVHDYAHYQREAMRDEVDERRERERVKKAAQRARKKTGTLVPCPLGTGGDMSPGTELGTGGGQTQGTSQGHVTGTCSPHDGRTGTGVSPGPVPSRPVPSRDHTHTRACGVKDEGQDVGQDQGSPEARQLLAELARHPSLAALATLQVAEQLVTDGAMAGTTTAEAVAAVGDLASKAGVAAARGQPWSADYLSDKAAAYVRHARHRRRIKAQQVDDDPRAVDPIRPLRPEERLDLPPMNTPEELRAASAMLCAAIGEKPRRRPVAASQPSEATTPAPVARTREDGAAAERVAGIEEPAA